MRCCKLFAASFLQGAFFVGGTSFEEQIPVRSVQYCVVTLRVLISTSFLSLRGIEDIQQHGHEHSPRACRGRKSAKAVAGSGQDHSTCLRTKAVPSVLVASPPSAFAARRRAQASDETTIGGLVGIRSAATPRTGTPTKARPERRLRIKWVLRGASRVPQRIFGSV